VHVSFFLVLLVGGERIVFLGQVVNFFFTLSQKKLSRYTVIFFLTNRARRRGECGEFLYKGGALA
jgi:hypothetical protein